MLYVLLAVLVLVIAGTVAGVVRARRFRGGIEADFARVRESAPPPRRADPLPPVLAAYADRALPDPVGPARSTTIEQRGEMRLQPGAKWQPFSAKQVYAVGALAFVWSARFKIFRVVDCLVEGAGRLEARLLGGAVRVAHASGAAATEAQLLRYLAEIAWVPHAIRHNPHIAWRAVGAEEVEGRLESAPGRLALRFSFAGGDITGVEGVRGRMVGREMVPTPWIGRFADYAELGGVRIPTHGEVAWVLDGEEWPCWRGTVTALAVD